ncbi:phenylalanine--tRNA ligase subunit alpha [Gulosibacter molinativorax]|uniref:Phenylalanine--tRNA ligase alpha subunit n=1 Tax=Gulosibacter molinativorax TaxID=256821 RepID=A0ABT7CA07_9MICO|nr:phenylalanine--tRNA ligase subunit alpha [Gulosibacter molinativorax]MDJ1371577.1 phenylalanine--tRNA ligase subunit alpha [Gulosibacter molinativorax]QUY61080.1 Phenylalanine--tRNA ligase alpha subunit [Gulosibacter molinativorax]
MSATNSTENPITPEAVSAAVSDALEAIAQAPDAQALKQVRSQHVGEGSPIAKLNSMMREVPKEFKKDAGKLVGSARGEINQAFTAREEELAAAEEAARLEAETVDVTAAPIRERNGARHPLTMLRDRVSDIFVGMGWDIVDGPELESEWYNFDALNFDPDHPAREMQDTFFVEPADRHMLLRTHTSPLQMRSMIERGAPLYILAPGRTFRTDELDATHTPVFMQFEGLAIDKDLTMAHLRGTLEHFAKAMFGEEAKIRLRNNFFPFTEPSAEMDIWHPLAKGGPRWIEWGGCGMVHPNLLKAAGLDPEEYQGFAFGMGIERTLMFRNELTDMHDIVEGDVRFSEQFGMVI